jgi:hypothetical protein
MKIEYAKNPRWANAEHTIIDVVVKFEHFTDEVPFTASSDDVEDHGRAVFADIVSGKYGPVAEAA